MKFSAILKSSLICVVLAGLVFTNQSFSTSYAQDEMNCDQEALLTALADAQTQIEGGDYASVQATLETVLAELANCGSAEVQGSPEETAQGFIETLVAEGLSDNLWMMVCEASQEDVTTAVDTYISTYHTSTSVDVAGITYTVANDKGTSATVSLGGSAAGRHMSETFTLEPDTFYAGSELPLVVVDGKWVICTVMPTEDTLDMSGDVEVEGSPEETVNAFIVALMDGDMETLWPLVCEASQEDVTTAISAYHRHSLDDAIFYYSNAGFDTSGLIVEVTHETATTAEVSLSGTVDGRHMSETFSLDADNVYQGSTINLQVQAGQWLVCNP